MNDSLRNAICKLTEVDNESGVWQGIYVIEECSELTKELTKVQRNKGSVSRIIDEACDVLTTIFVLLNHLEVSEEFIKEQIIYKCNRAIDRYYDHREV